MDKVEQLVWAQEFIMEDIFSLIEDTQNNMNRLIEKVSFLQKCISEAVDEVAISRG